jgi:hypothetical protein
MSITESRAFGNLNRVLDHKDEKFVKEKEQDKTLVTQWKIGYSTHTGKTKYRKLDDTPRQFKDQTVASLKSEHNLHTIQTLSDTFVHPGGLCQNVLATGRCTVTGTTVVIGREAITLTCEHPRSIELAADRPDFRLDLTVDRETGVILRLVETIGGTVGRDAEVLLLDPDAALPPSAFEFTFPTGTTMLY